MSEEEEQKPENAPPGSVRNPDWSEWYAACPRWGDVWSNLDIPAEWPPGYRVVGQRMFLDGKECVPLALQKEKIRVEHAQKGHLGFERTWEILSRQFNWADARLAKFHTRSVIKECHNRQANDRPRNTLGPIVYTPIPPPSCLM